MTPQTFIAQLSRNERAATIVTLSGDLGAGKTTFVQGVARALGVAEVVTSPTFVIEKIYCLPGSLPAGGWQRLIHIDAYRLKSAQELEVLEWSDLLADSGNLILLEWPERVAAAIPAHAVRLRFDIRGDERTISLDGNEEKNHI